MNFAVVNTGGKQYLVQEGDIIRIEKIIGDFKVGSKIKLDVLATGDEGSIKLDSKKKADAEIVEIGRDEKVMVVKYKQKSRYFKKNGHNQPHFKVKVLSF